jgi:phosphoglycolate phosphatase-like HAD superfamily hydrolase
LKVTKTKLFIDFDGTVISSKERCGQVFCHVLGLEASSYMDSYISQRQSGRSNQDIILSEGFLQPSDLGAFSSQWMEAIEAPQFLQYDTVLEDVKPWLQSKREDFELHLCTDRQSRSGTMEQVKALGLMDLFDGFLITEKQISKSDLILSAAPSVSAHDWIIGDSPSDAREGRELHISTCCVLSGFSNLATLSIETPDLIVKSLIDFPIGPAVL